MQASTNSKGLPPSTKYSCHISQIPSIHTGAAVLYSISSPVKNAIKTSKTTDTEGHMICRHTWASSTWEKTAILATTDASITSPVSQRQGCFRLTYRCTLFSIMIPLFLSKVSIPINKSFRNQAHRDRREQIHC